MPHSYYEIASYSVGLVNASRYGQKMRVAGIDPISHNDDIATKDTGFCCEQLRILLFERERTMRVLWSSFMFIFTLIVGAIAFAATAIELPGVMRQLIEWAQQLPPYLSSLGLSNNYLVWTDIILSGDKLVLLAFVLATRLVFALIGTALGPLFGVGAKSKSESAFQKWG